MRAEMPMKEAYGRTTYLPMSRCKPGGGKE